ncbi:MAG: hypothetical protein A2X48_18130 [Lentisphaerae bacterium GWF2_49_21]|nr:MAG: hypothetical protein A2X48_18130 [Lentisphaerae bacterium GWF2_49_21]
MKTKQKINAENKSSIKQETGNKDVESGIMDMDEAIFYLKTTRPTFYRWLRSGKFKGMKVGRQWRFYKEELDGFLKGEGPRIDLSASPDPIIKTISDKLAELGVKSWNAAGADKLKSIVYGIICLGYWMRATDIHISSHPVAGDPMFSHVHLRYRIDGILRTITEFDSRLLQPIIDEFKSMAKCDLHEHQCPQDGRILVKVDNDKKTLDLRICFLPSSLGETATIRILDSNSLKLDIGSMHISKDNLDRIHDSINLPNGMIIVSGPTGSGKTTVLYAILHSFENKNSLKIVSIEDPVEYILEKTVQVGVRVTDGVTFLTATRAVLRSDPDVIMNTEIREREQLKILQMATLTGHITISAMHADSAAATIRRLIDLSGETMITSDSIKFIIGQRLIRILCPHCAKAYEPSQDIIEKSSCMARTGGLDWSSLPHSYMKAVGCPKCAMLGLRGRRVIMETLKVTPEISALIRSNASLEQIQHTAIEQGMTTIAGDGIRRFASGETTFDEVLRVTK